MPTQSHSPSSVPPLGGRRLASSTSVMELFGYKNRASFHAWVKANGVPHIRLNARKIVFDEAQLDDWISQHSTGRAA